MDPACRATILCRMADLRRPHILPKGIDPVPPYQLAWNKAQEAESYMLEIAELAYVLQADGFPVAEVFGRIGKVLDPPDPDFAEMHRRLGRWSHPLQDYVLAYLKRHQPAYLELGSTVYTTAFTMAEMWGEIYAERLTGSNWPPEDMLHGSPKGPEAIEAFSTGRLARDARRIKARAVPGDQIRNYNTGSISWVAMMGSAGFALVRQGRSIDHLETMMN